MTDDYLYIDTEADLEELAQRLRGNPWLCLDTEFMREKTYYPRLCLLQVSTPELVACVDPLALEDLTPLLDVIYDPGITKVFHAAKQDLEILYHLRGEVPAPLFDTQIAAALLCHNDQIGYASLVEQTLGVQLDKAHTRTDWSLRPLDAGQLRYAADDVLYLHQVYLAQRQALEHQGRLEWLEEDFAALSDASQYAPAPHTAWRRIKDARRLKGQQLAVMQALAAWREHRAMGSDKPRKWVLRDEVLTELARAMPGSLAALAKIRGLDKGALNRYGGDLLAAIEHGKQQPREDWPVLEPRITITPQQEAIVDAMMALVRLRATEQALSPAMLTTRRQLERLLTGDRQVEILHGWRGATIGNDLQALLNGELYLGIEQGALKIATT